MIQFPLWTMIYNQTSVVDLELLSFHRVLLAPIRKRWPSFVSFFHCWRVRYPETGDKIYITSSVSVAGPYVTT